MSLPLEEVVIDDDSAEECFCQQAQPAKEMSAMAVMQERLKDAGCKAVFFMKRTICQDFSCSYGVNTPLIFTRRIQLSTEEAPPEHVRLYSVDDTVNRLEMFRILGKR